MATRQDLCAFADRLLAAVRPYASPSHARITLPGPEGGFGRAVDGLEGFARTFLLAGFRLTGEHGDDPTNLAEWYATGLDGGSSRGAADRWVRLSEHPQAKVEAASLALVLDMTRPWIWDRLSARVQEQLVDYLTPAVGDDTYPPTNWLWFRLVVQTFLRSVGGPFDLAEMQADLDTHDSLAREDGWLADGPERSFDHYAGWALHLYPTLWSRMSGAADLAGPRLTRDVAALDRFLLDAIALVGGDGSPLIQGRSLVYRFAAAAPFWVGALADVPSTSAGGLRTAALAVVGHFLGHGVPDERGLLTLGWFDPWPTLAQSYSGPSSPYWASKGLLGLAMPVDHPVWTSVSEPLPVERADGLRIVRAPGWLVSGTQADGVIRVVNHGTDHAMEGARVGDSPLYTRLGYSTATSPLLDHHAWSDPVDQSAVLLDARGRSSHRAGMRTLALEVTGASAQAGHVATARHPSRTAAPEIAYGASVADVRWLDAGSEQDGAGSGWTGTPTPAGRLTVHSVVRGPWEVRVVEVAEQAPAAVALRVGGWPVAGDEPVASTSATTATARTERLESRIDLLVGDGTLDVVRLNDASPLGPVALVPVMELRPVPSGPVVALVTLGGSTSAASTPPRAELRCEPAAGCSSMSLDVTWPDGARTTTHLSHDGGGHPTPSCTAPPGRTRAGNGMPR
ncbi:DUF2264 domain-containing protein [Cellulomonas sp. SG140]|uniref:DUF2264 domain-containing protein n=1 Tax=Cellulomonas sp. SG140 TaxID=2976536 RepID=UPI0021E75670|nr:DUF2264 domain-containing protein [Cellulomonas sp. SG140]